MPLDFSSQADPADEQPKGLDFSSVADPVDEQPSYLGGLWSNTVDLGAKMYASSAAYTKAAEHELGQDIAAPLPHEFMGMEIRDEPVAKALRWAKTALDVGNVPFQAGIGAIMPIVQKPLGTVASLPDIIMQPKGIDVPEEILERGEDITQQLAMLPMLADGAALFGKTESIARDTMKAAKSKLRPEAAAPAERLEPYLGPIDARQNQLAKAFDETQVMPAMNEAASRDPQIAATVQTARAEAITGEGEQGYFGTGETSDAEFNARMAAATELPAAGGANRTPDIHDVAREIDPQLMARRDEADTRIQTYRRWIDELDQQRRESAPAHPRAAELQTAIDDALDKVNGVEERLTKRAADRVAAARAELEDLLHPTADSADMVHVRGLLTKEMSDRAHMGPEINALYRRAAARVAGLPEPAVAAPVAAPETPAVAEPAPAEAKEATAALRDTAASPPSQTTREEPTPQQFNIASDWAARLIKGGVAPDVAEAHGQLMAARYEARAAAFEGKRGTASQMYLRDAPNVTPVKRQRARAMELAQGGNKRKLFQDIINELPAGFEINPLARDAIQRALAEPAFLELLRNNVDDFGNDYELLNTLAQQFLAERTNEVPAVTALREDMDRYDAAVRDQHTANDNRTTLEQGEAAPTFYSALQRGLEEKGPNKAPADQWRNIITNLAGVKREELDWSGVMDWLAQQKGAVTKDALLEQLAQNEVRVQEVTHGKGRGDIIPDKEAVAQHEDAFRWRALQLRDLKERALTAAREGRQTEAQNLQNEWAQEERNQDALHERMVNETMERQGLSGKPAKYASYNLPGGQNYRELLLTLPEAGEQFDPAKLVVEHKQRSTTQGSTALTYDGHFVGTFDDPPMLNAETGRYEQRTQSYWQDVMRRRFAGDPSLGIKPLGGGFRSGHWDEPNILAHIRMDDRTGPGDRKILHVAEVQSDWHQTGRREGYKGEPQRMVRWRNRDSGNAGPWFDTQEEAETYRNGLPAALRERLTIETQTLPQKGVPNAPFKSTWHELAMKRVLRYAAEHGYDQIAWDTGETNADRYSLAHHVSSLKLFDQSAVPDAKGRYRLDAFDHHDERVYSEYVRAEELPGIVGEETARKLLAKAPSDWQRVNGVRAPITELSGVDLKLGGEGMKGFYDRILPQFMNKYVKKWGGKVEDGTVPALSARVPVHTVDITPKMRESVMEGQPLFQTARGQIDVRPGDTRNVITFFEGKHDPSTVLHETAHQWLEEFKADAAHELAPDRLKADYQTVTEWLGGAPDLDSRAGIRRHEKFARGFERYVMEGMAPSKELARVFERFRQWLTQVYERVTRLRVQLTPEMRAVFDRMLAVNPEHVVVAPERPTSATMAEIHRVDAESALPHHAGETADLVRSEIDEAAKREVPDVHAALARVGTEEPSPEAAGEPPAGEPAADGEPGPEPTGTPAGGAPEPLGVAAGGDQPPAEGDELGGSPEGGGGPAPANDIDSVNERTAGGANGRLIDKAGNIRLDNLNRPEDVDDCLRQIAAEQNDFAEARFGDEGRQLHATIMAARTLMARTMDEMGGARDKAALDTASEADLLAYKDAANRLTMIANRVATLTHAWGYAGQAFRRLEGLPDFGASMNMAKLAERTQNMTLFQLKQEAQLGSKLPTRLQQTRFLQDVRMSWWQGTRPMIVELFVNNLISGPVTHLAYTIGNLNMALYKAAVETPLAAGLSTLRGDKEGARIYLRESRDQLTGIVKGAIDGWSAAGKAFKTGTAEMLPSELGELSEEDRLAYANRGPKEHAIPGMVGRIINKPSDSVAAIHTFGRSIGYAQEMWRRAGRFASDQGLSGAARDRAMAEWLNAPPLADQQAAAMEATRMVLMNRAKYGTWFYHLKQITEKNLAAKLIAPFMQIGANLLHEGFIERTPLGVFDETVRRNLLGTDKSPEGRIATDIQRGKVVAGTTLSLAVAGLTLQGTISGGGPSHPAERRVLMASGWQPYSIKIGSQWVPFRKFLGPLGPLVAGVADMTEIAHHAEDKNLLQIAHASVLGLAEVVADESWFRGVSDFVDAARNYDNASGERYFRNFATNFIPFSVGLSQVTRMVDHYSREQRTLLDAVKAHIPGLSQELMPRRDVFGNPIASRVAVSPSTAINDPVITAMQHAQFFPASPERSIRGVRLTPAQFDRFSQLAGNYLHLRLSELVKSPGWGNIPAPQQAEIMHKVMSGAREQARGVVMMQSRGTANDIVKQAIDNKRKVAGVK